MFAISFTVTDRAISSKFPTPRVSKGYTRPTFQKNFKNGGQLEFSNFCKECAKCEIFAISLISDPRVLFKIPPLNPYVI